MITDHLRDKLTRAVHDALGTDPTLTRRVAIRNALRELADEQHQLIQVIKRDKARRLAERRAANPQALRGRKPGDFIRIQHDAEMLRIYIGRALYYALGTPARLDVQRIGGRVQLITTSAPHGYAVVVPTTGMPRIKCDAARDLVRLEDGRYQADVRGTRLIIGDPLGIHQEHDHAR